MYHFLPSITKPHANVNCIKNTKPLTSVTCTRITKPLILALIVQKALKLMLCTRLTKPLASGTNQLIVLHAVFPSKPDHLIQAVQSIPPALHTVISIEFSCSLPWLTGSV